MAIVSTNFTGCCAARIFYHIGGSHGYPTAKDQDQFDSWLLNKGSSVNVAITDNQQVQSRKFLKAAGFDSVKLDHLELHYISGTKLRNYLASRKVELQKIKDEEAKKKSVFAAQRAARIPPNVYRGIVYQADVNFHLRGFGARIDRMTDIERDAAAQRLNTRYTGLNLTGREIRWHTNRSLRDLIYRRLHRLRRGF